MTNPLRRRKIKRALYEATWCIGTAAASAALLYWTLPVWLAAAVMAVVIAHEFGHYFVAAQLGQNPSLPFFIAFFIGVLGGTHVKGRDDAALQHVALAGPMIGALVSIAIIIGAMFAGFIPLAWAGFWLLVFQVWSGTFGSDGRRYRRHRNAVQIQEDANQTGPVSAAAV